MTFTGNIFFMSGGGGGEGGGGWALVLFQLFLGYANLGGYFCGYAIFDWYFLLCQFSKHDIL